MSSGPLPGSPLPPPRYSLRTLLLVVTGAACFFGLFWWFSPSVVAAVAVVGVLIATHVVGNALGTRLRDGETPTPRVIAIEHVDLSDKHAPATHLSQRRSLGWAVLLVTALGIMAGAAGGAYGMHLAYNLDGDVEGLAIAAVAFGALSGFATFGLATFAHVLATAMLQALRHK
jgi:hypothetical protein